MTEHDFNNGSGHGEVPEDSDQAFVSIARQLAQENTRIEPPAALIDRIESRLKPTRRHVRRPYEYGVDGSASNSTPSRECITSSPAQGRSVAESRRRFEVDH